MFPIFVGLGSNLGDRLNFLQRGMEELERLPETRIHEHSSVYHTEPVGMKDQPEFLNMVAAVESALPAAEFFQGLKTIERLLGRKQTMRWGPREIDLDVLYFGGLVLNEPNLRIPHPEIANRRFVLIPLEEIARDFLDPVRNLTVAELLQACTDTSAVRKSSLTLSLHA